MVVEINKNTPVEQITEMIGKAKSKKKSLKSFVGKLKRGIDGLEYQNEVRNEWN